jgi:hypothetical protein
MAKMTWRNPGHFLSQRRGPFFSTSELSGVHHIDLMDEFFLQS